MGTLAKDVAVAGSESRAGQPTPDARAARRARARLADRIVTYTLWGIAIALTGLLAYFIFYTIQQGASLINWRFITQSDVAGDLDGPELFNTFYILIFSLLICVPLGLGCAIYLVEYARQGIFTTIVRFATETLAGVPSIILGLFGFIFFASSVNGGLGFGVSRLAGTFTLVILNLPLLVRVSEDALRSVPGELREASAALGANKFQTVARVLVPAAIPALTTGVILTAGKMIGETAALLYPAGGNSSPTGWFSLNPFLPGDTLAVHLYELRAEGIVPNAQQIANSTATLLIILLLVFNLGLRYLAGLLNRRLAGASARKTRNK
ncbi:MAG TPA: phosphate ABC transporter permease PstA [Ktedonobacterales bacterium]|nr:phosphate ABC transporter permease PstA [Ktedonobacterales bacterium]